jgi:hypothetical protein
MIRSALFKLYNHHSCDLFNEESLPIESNVAPRVRQCMQRCLDMIREICPQVVSFVQDFRRRLSHATMQSVSPLMLHCIYNCAVNLSWLFVETNNPQYLTGKLICEDTLRSMSVRWKVAGNNLLIAQLRIKVPL